MTTLNISIPDAMRAWIDEQVASGQYASASDYLRDLIRSDQRDREALRQALIEGERSGESRRSVRQIAAATKTRLARG